jgi:hypothetical protein
MSVAVQWLDEESRRAVLLEFDGDWNWNDFHAVVQQSHQMIGSMPYPVDLVVHHKANKEARNPMVHFQKAIKNQPKNLRQVILVNENASVVFIRFLQSIAHLLEKLRLAGTPTRFVSTLDEARTLVNSSNATAV